MQCQVLRPFLGMGHQHQRGDIVDTTDWPAANVDALIADRFLTPLPVREAVFEASPTRRRKE